MNETVNSGRSANKRAVIDISDGESNEPPAKKDAEPAPTQEVLELQQKLQQQKLQQTKTEKKLEGAIRIAGMAQARVEYLENLIDKKPATIDEREKKIVELSSKLVEADGREKKLADEMQKNIELKMQLKEEEEKAVKERVLYSTKIDNLSNRRNELTTELIEEKNKIDELTINRDELERKLSLADEKEKKLIEEQQNKVNSLMKQLEVEKSRAKEDQTKISELTINRDELEHKLADIEKKILMEEQQKKIDELSRRRNALEKRLSAADDIEQKLVAESKKKMDELRKHRANLARDLAGVDEQKKTMAEEQQIKKNRKLNQNEDGQQQLLPKQRQPFQAVQQQSDNVSLKKVGKTQIVVSTSHSPVANTGGTNNSSNIFEIHSTVDPTRGALRFDFAVEVLTEQNKKTFKSYGSSKEEYAQKRKEVLKDEKLHCTYCKKTCEKEEILSHFLSTQHIKKVKECHRIASTAFISYDAVKYWINKLESIEKQQPTAVAAAAAANDGSSSDKKETKKENRVVTMQERENNDRISE